MIPANAESGEAHHIRLTRRSVRTIDRFGGTMLHSSRTNPAKVQAADLAGVSGGTLTAKDGRVAARRICLVLEALKIDALVAIGSDDNVLWARLHKEGVWGRWPRPRPWTMTCSAPTTAWAFPPASVALGGMYVTALRTAAGSHERIAVIELFGRNSGGPALISGYLTDADPL